MISGIFIYGLRGEVLASRIYKDGLRRAVTDVFRVQVISNPDCKVPILTLGSTSFSYIRHENLYIVAVTRHDVDAALVYELLYKFVEISTAALGVLNETSCTAKVHVVYELLGELVDFGYPQHTDASVLDQVLSNGSGVSRFLPKDLLRRDSILSTSAGNLVSRAATSATPWRSANVKYRQNEIYLDIIESVNVVMTGEGSLVSSNVVGKVKMKTHLSGMPQCMMGLNDTVKGADGEDVAHLEDFQMHQCVNLSEFSRSHTITFLPPDGEFELMNYSVVTGITTPFRITASVREVGKTHVEYDVRVTAQFPIRTAASDVVCKIPVPSNVSKTSFKTTRGKGKYNPAHQTIDWRLNRISGSQESKFTGTAELAPGGIASVWSRPPIALEFNISMYCSSGLKVQYLKLDDSAGYRPLKWVRYLTVNGSYEVRI